jgi:hypothetical protein
MTDERPSENEGHQQNDSEAPRQGTLSGDSSENQEKVQIAYMLGLDRSEVEGMALEDLLDELKQQHTELMERDVGARPHINFPLDEEEFRSALKTAMSGENAHIESKDRGINVDSHCELGFLHLDIFVRQCIEMSFSDPEYVHSEYVGTDDPEQVLSQYDEDPINLLIEPSGTDENTLSARAIYQPMLLRDMSQDCAEAVDTMHEVVDEHPDLYWGGEPSLGTVTKGYGFSTYLFIR